MDSSNENNINDNEEEFLKNLNKEQKEAVKYIKGPQIISAGAGTGKTTVLTYKIAYLWW
jgi:DNA helicase-2/ATP-dependent DNA helicase PcrA